VAVERPIDRLRHPDAEPLETAHEPRRSVRFDQQVKMIALDGEVEDAEARARCQRERIADGREEPLSAERRHALPDAQRDVGRTVGLVRCATTMRNARPTTGRGFAAGAFAPSAPPVLHGHREGELWGPALHFE
jgi:hypothetical protein